MFGAESRLDPFGPGIDGRGGSQTLTVLRMKVDAVSFVYVTAKKVCHLRRDAEGFVERGTREIQFFQVFEDGKVRADVIKLAAAVLVPGVRQDGRHLSVVADSNELPVFTQSGRGEQSFGDSHLRSLVYQHQVEILFRPVDCLTFRRASLDKIVEAAGRAAHHE